MHNYHKRSRYKENIAKLLENENNIICINHWKINYVLNDFRFELISLLLYTPTYLYMPYIHYTYAYPLCHLLNHFILRFLSLHVFGLKHLIWF